MRPEELLQNFAARCRQHGLAVTHQRTVIYRELIASESHPTPEAVYERVKAQIPAISLGTVYKNIKTFLEAGLLREVSLHHGTQRLDANTDPHHHLVCRECRQIFDLPAAEVHPVVVQTKKGSEVAKSGFRIERFSIEAIGVCAACAQRRESHS